jgi:hypothetical protein
MQMLQRCCGRIAIMVIETEGGEMGMIKAAFCRILVM